MAKQPPGLGAIEDFDASASAEVLALINTCMRPESSLSMALDFPLLIGAGAKSRRMVIADSGKIVAHAAARILSCQDQRPGGNDFLVANIGAVCVAKSHRGRGLASQLIRAFHREFEGSQISAAVLWTDKPDVYTGLGYREFGAETQFQVKCEQLAIASDLDVRPHRESDLRAMMSLRAEDPVYIQRSLSEASRLFQLPESKTRVVLREGKLVAYLCFGKGLDFAGTVCEWAGPVQWAAAALAQILSEEQLSEAVIIGPSWRQDYLNYFNALGCPSHSAAMALMCPFEASHQESPPTLESEGVYIWGLDSN